MVTPRYSNFSVISCPMVGPNLVSKHECVGHVQKRMGTALREKTKEKFVNERGERVRMRWKGLITDKTIKLLTYYYGQVIRQPPVFVRQCRMLPGGFLPLPVLCTSIAPAASGLGASSTGHLPISSHLHPTHPPSIQTLFLLSKRSLSDSFTLH